MVNINNTELQNMTYNGQEVNTWIHNGVEVFSNIDITNRVKYLIAFSNATNEPVNIKKYSMKYGVIIEETNINASVNYAPTPYYEDDYFTIGRFNYTGLPTKWIFTPKVEGLSTIIKGTCTFGSQYGGTADQILPYLEGSNVVMMFEPSDIGIKYVPGLLDAEWTFSTSHTEYSYDHSVSESEIMVSAKKTIDSYVAYATGTMTATFDTKGYNRVRVKVQCTHYDGTTVPSGSVSTNNIFPYCETINDGIWHSNMGHSHYLHLDCGDSDKFTINLSATDATNADGHKSTVKLTEIAFYKDRDYSLNGEDIDVFNANIITVWGRDNGGDRSDPLNNVSYLGYAETSRTLNSEYVREVAAPTNMITKGTDVVKNDSKVVKIYTPTSKAVEKYKYAWLTFYKDVGITNPYSSSGANLIIDDKSIHMYEKNKSLSNRSSLETVRFKLKNGTKLTALNNSTDINASDYTYSNIAISGIRFANDPDFWKSLLNGRELEDIVKDKLGNEYYQIIKNGYWLMLSRTVNNEMEYRLLFSQTPISYLNDGAGTFYANHGCGGKCGYITFDIVDDILVLNTNKSYTIYDLPTIGRVVTAIESHSGILYSNFNVYAGERNTGGYYINTTTLYYSPL